MTKTKPVTEARKSALQQGYIRAIPHSAAVGQTIIEVGEGRALLSQPYQDQLLGDRDRGLIHTAVQLSLLDSAFGAAVFSALRRGESIATLDLRMDYHRPATAGADLLAEARVEQVTRQIVFVSGRVWQSDPDQPTAVARASFMRGANNQSAVAADERSQDD